MRDLLARHATMILDGGPSICGNPMTLDVPAAAGFADRLRTVFFALVSLECTLTRGAVQRNGLDFDLHSRVLLLLAYPIQPAGLGPTVHASLDRVPVAEPLRKPAPLTAVLGDIADCVQAIPISQAPVAALPRQAGLNNRILLCRNRPARTIAPGSHRVNTP